MSSSTGVAATAAAPVRYNDDIVRLFTIATMFWASLGSPQGFG